MDFDQGLQSMLHGAFVAYSHIRKFEIGDEAAHFVAHRTVSNINNVCKTDYEKYAAAVGAVASLPAVAFRIEAQTETRVFLDQASIIALMQTCSDGPWPICSSEP
jgi:hypothetical protein